MFYSPRWECTSDPFVKLLDVYRFAKVTQLVIPDKDNTKLNFIDNILLTYAILLLEVTRESNFLNHVVGFIFLIRSYLNVVGWEHNRYLNSYGLSCDVGGGQFYCSRNICDQVPELINDFVAVFVGLDEGFAKNAKEYVDLA
jgi:hypothetical protein